MPGPRYIEIDSVVEIIEISREENEEKTLKVI